MNARFRKPELWPWFRDNLTPEERREIIDFNYAHPQVPVRCGYSTRTRRFFAEVDGHREESRIAIEAFRAAVAPRVIASLLGGDAA